jgi:hypothetical protein
MSDIIIQKIADSSRYGGLQLKEDCPHQLVFRLKNATSDFASTYPEF